MTKPMVRIHNSKTDEILDREMTAAEFAEYEIYRTGAEAVEAELISKAAAKAALLERLGITADEAKLLLA